MPRKVRFITDKDIETAILWVKKEISHSETMERMGVSSPTIYIRLSRALQKAVQAGLINTK